MRLSRAAILRAQRGLCKPVNCQYNLGSRGQEIER